MKNKNAMMFKTKINPPADSVRLVAFPIRFSRAFLIKGAT